MSLAGTLEISNDDMTCSHLRHVDSVALHDAPRIGVRTVMGRAHAVSAQASRFTRRLAALASFSAVCRS